MKSGHFPALFVIIKPGVFNRMSGDFPTELVATKLCVVNETSPAVCGRNKRGFLMRSPEVSSRFCGDKLEYFKPKHDLTKWFYAETRPDQHCHKIQFKIKPKET